MIVYGILGQNGVNVFAHQQLMDRQTNKFRGAALFGLKQKMRATIAKGIQMSTNLVPLVVVSSTALL